MTDKNFKVKHGLAMGEGIIRFDAETSTWQLSTDGVTFSQVASASTTLDGLSDVSVSAALAGDFLKWNGTAWVPSTVALGTNTTGNYVADVVSGTGVTVSHTPGEGSSASISIGQSVATTASVTFAHVSAPLTGNVTGDVTGNAGTATSLQTARAINLAGDISGSASFNGTADVTITATVQPNSVALGTDTTGNFVADVVAGTGVTVTHTPGEGSSASIAIGQSVATNANPLFAGATLDAVQIGITAANEIDTTTGNLTIDSAGGTTTIDDNLVVSGNLTVSGTTTSVNTETVTIDDNIIVLNNNETGSPSQNAGIEIERGTSSNVLLRWNETNDKWEITNDGSAYGNIVTTADSGTVTSTMIVDGTIVNADINSSAAIAHSKLANATAGQVLLGTTTTGVVTATTVSGDVTITGAGVTAIASNVIVDADINSSAAIALSKLATSTSQAIGVGSVELGHASDTTLARGAAGRLTVEGINVPTISSTDTFSNKSISFGSNTVTGTLSQFNTALTDADFVSLAGIETLTNKTLTSPQINSGTASAMVLTGSLTAGGGTGTSGQFLQSTGTGVQWAVASPSASVTTVSSNSATEVYAFNPSTYGSADLIVQVTQGSKKTSMKTFVSHDASASATNVNTSKIEYGTPAIPLTISSSYSSGTPTLNTWTTRTSNFTTSTIWEVVNGNGVWVAVGESNRIRSSTDGITWVTRTSTFSTMHSIKDVKYGNGNFVAVGTYYNGSQMDNRVQSSTDGITWVSRLQATENNALIYQSVNIGDVYLVGAYGGMFRKSTDLITWTTQTSSFGQYEMPYALAYASSTWLAAGYGGQIRTSTDSVTWVTRDANFGSSTINSAAYGNGIWTLVGNGGQIRTSTDTINWTTRTSNFDAAKIVSVGYGNNIWAAAGENGQLRVSTDAITWVTKTSNFATDQIEGVAFGNNLWVAVGRSGKIRTSSGVGVSSVSITATITDATSTSATVKVLPTLIEA